MKNPKKEKSTPCESCAYFDYDDELGCDVCTINLDEDEVTSFYASGHNSCPYYSFYDEYRLVRKQN